ncbi:acyltransferase [Chryseobacterium sp. W4I1]|uniref:acyltransferase family protein n=1 Tax=Chryseobacterium sp. W4I1 TaxID=3042293 RepID=UPI00277EBFFC|nr:acyltransferase [Chryseobacterium sp. W4I1]MDQ0784205.1 peptidoglycan/LPS O-acetylase OafA/YrhL [Chryseobacterium sp. W4I1]
MNIATQINRSNNFDFLRLLFASLVIVSHSYPLTGKAEIIGTLTNGQLSLGSLSVDCFFIMSGYLIMMSLQRSKSPQEYMWKRLLRLYPAYIVLLIFTILFLPVVYIGINIFSEKTFWSYFPNSLSLYKIQYEVKGVFENNPYPRAINGSLWSLSYEFTMYIVLLLLFPLRQYKHLNIIIISIFLSAFYFTITESHFLESTMKRIFLYPIEFYRLCTYFMAGSLLVFINFKKINSFWIRCLLFLALTTSLYFECYKYTSPILLPLLILLIGVNKNRYISSIGSKIGDISYGVYIYAFIIQQTLMHYFGLGTLRLMLISTIITYIFAYGSWHLVEKRMLTYKNLIK